MSLVSTPRPFVRCSSLTSVALVAVSLAVATSANASITHVTLNQTVTSKSGPYSLSITQGKITYTWEIGIQGIGQFGSYSYFTPTSTNTGVAATVAQPLQAERFIFEEGIGQTDFFSTFPTGGSSNNNLLLHNYGNGTGNFPSFGITQYAGFCFGSEQDTFFGWASFTMSGPNSFTLNDIAYTNGEIGAGMLIPAPGAVALLGLAGVAGTRRRR